MPVVVAGSSRSADALIRYVLEDKPNQKGERYVMASGTGGLLVSVARHQMRDVRKKWRKDKPGAFVQAYHVIESFAKDELDPDDPDSWMTAQKLGHALAEDRFPGRQVLVVTQRDGKTGCVHNHLVINSIETNSGKSLNSSIVMHARLVEAHERVLEEQGFEQRHDLRQAFSDAQERMERGELSGLRRASSSARSEEREYQRYILWETECDVADDLGVSRNPEPFSLTVLRVYIEKALTDPAAVDWGSFVAAGRKHHVRIEQRGKKGRGISYGMIRKQPDGTLAEPSPSDRRRCSTLGAAYEMNAVEEALARNAAALALPPVTTTLTTQVMLPPTPVESVARPQELSAKERMLLALQEASEDADAAAEAIRQTSTMTPADIDAAATEDDSAAPTELLAAPSPSPSPSPSPGTLSPALPASREFFPTTEDVEGVAKVMPAAEAVASDTAENADDNSQPRRPGIFPATSAEPAAERPHIPEKRRRPRRYPELFDDAAAPTAPEHDRELGG